MAATNPVVDELHTATSQLESEGHGLAAKFRALVDKLRGDAQTVVKDGTAEADVLAAALHKVLVPALDRVKAEVVAEGKAAFGQALDAAQPVLAAGTTDAHKALADALAAVRGLLPAAVSTPAAK